MFAFAGDSIVEIGEDGREVWKIKTPEGAGSALVQGDNVLYAIGTFFDGCSSEGDCEFVRPHPVIAAFHSADGSPVAEFGDGGVARPPFEGTADVLVPRNGALLLAGTVPGPGWYDGETDLYFARLSAHGEVLKGPSVHNAMFYDSVGAIADLPTGPAAACRAWDGSRGWPYLLRVAE